MDIVLLFECLRQGVEGETSGDRRAKTSLKQKQLTHRPGKWKWILSLSLLLTRGETECFESSPKIQEGKLKVQTVPPCPSAVTGDPIWETIAFQ